MGELFDTRRCDAEVFFEADAGAEVVAVERWFGGEDVPFFKDVVPAGIEMRGLVREQSNAVCHADFSQSLRTFEKLVRLPVHCLEPRQAGDGTGAPPLPETQKQRVAVVQLVRHSVAASVLRDDEGCHNYGEPFDMTTYAAHVLEP